MKAWSNFRNRTPEARMVCINHSAIRDVQAKERHDILNIGGFSDQVFTLVAEFANGNLNANHWIGVIEATDLYGLKADFIQNSSMYILWLKERLVRDF